LVPILNLFALPLFFSGLKLIYILWVIALKEMSTHGFCQFGSLLNWKVFATLVGDLETLLKFVLVFAKDSSNSGLEFIKIAFEL
jgi:hypothetical protein